MQLMIEVLPAPFGPMIENSSPSLTPKLTSVSARTPPKRNDTPRTSKACSTDILRLRPFGRSQDGCQQDQAGSWRRVNQFLTVQYHVVSFDNHPRTCGLATRSGSTLVLDLKPFLADGLVGVEFGRRALKHDSAVA